MFDQDWDNLQRSLSSSNQSIFDTLKQAFDDINNLREDCKQNCQKMDEIQQQVINFQQPQNEYIYREEIIPPIVQPFQDGEEEIKPIVEEVHISEQSENIKISIIPKNENENNFSANLNQKDLLEKMENIMKAHSKIVDKKHHKDMTIIQEKISHVYTRLSRKIASQQKLFEDSLQTTQEDNEEDILPGLIEIQDTEEGILEGDTSIFFGEVGELEERIEKIESKIDLLSSSEVDGKEESEVEEEVEHIQDEDTKESITKEVVEGVVSEVVKKREDERRREMVEMEERIFGKMEQLMEEKEVEEENEEREENNANIPIQRSCLQLLTRNHLADIEEEREVVVDQLKKVRREVTMLMKEDSRVTEFFQKICELEKVLESGESFQVVFLDHKHLIQDLSHSIKDFNNISDSISQFLTTLAILTAGFTISHQGEEVGRQRVEISQLTNHLDSLSSSLSREIRHMKHDLESIKKENMELRALRKEERESFKITSDAMADQVADLRDEIFTKFSIFSDKLDKKGNSSDIEAVRVLLTSTSDKIAKLDDRLGVENQIADLENELKTRPTRLEMRNMIEKMKSKGESSDNHSHVGDGLISQKRCLVCHQSVNRDQASNMGNEDEYFLQLPSGKNPVQPRVWKGNAPCSQSKLVTPYNPPSPHHDHHLTPTNNEELDLYYRLEHSSSIEIEQLGGREELVDLGEEQSPLIMKESVRGRLKRQKDAEILKKSALSLGQGAVVPLHQALFPSGGEEVHGGVQVVQITKTKNRPNSAPSTKSHNVLSHQEKRIKQNKKRRVQALDRSNGKSRPPKLSVTTMG